MLDMNNTNYLKPSLRLIKFIDNNFFNSKKKMQLINNIENKNFEILLSRLFYNFQLNPKKFFFIIIFLIQEEI